MLGIAALVVLTAACGDVTVPRADTSTSRPATPTHPLSASTSPGADKKPAGTPPAGTPPTGTPPGGTQPTVTEPTTPTPTVRTVPARPATCPELWRFDTPDTSLNRQSPRPGLSETLVPADPTILTICRFAGLDQKVKAGTLERSRVVTGAALAAFVEYSDRSTWPTVNPDGLYYCPMSIGLVDLLQFVYPSGSPVVVSVDVDGCRFVSNGYRTVWGESIGSHVTALVGTDTLHPA